MNAPKTCWQQFAGNVRYFQLAKIEQMVPEEIAFAQRNTRCLRFSISSPEQLLHRAISLIDRLICVRRGRSIGVGDRNPAESLAGNVARPLALGPVRVPQGVVF